MTSEPGTRSDARAVPLVIDLDGTLILSDLLWETLVLNLKHDLPGAWRLPLWLARGKAGFKESVAAGVELDPEALPYDRALLAFIQQERERGRSIVLATGAQRRLAEQVAAHLGLFDSVIATGDGINLTSHNKAAHLENCTARAATTTSAIRAPICRCGWAAATPGRSRTPRSAWRTGARPASSAPAARAWPAHC